MTIIKQIQKQKGVVLVFSLVMLLLITLAGVSMVQQNRLQFMMAANVQTQSSGFANAEDVLALAENYIAGQRYTTWPLVGADGAFPDAKYTCNKAAGTTPPKFDQLKPANITASLGLSLTGASATITQTACMASSVEIACTPDATETNGWDAAEMQCYQSDQAQCATEVYTVQVTVTDSTGSDRVIDSRFAIRCDM